MSSSTIAKLDKIVMRLVELSRDICKKPHKYYRVTVPQALSGTNLVQLLQELLHLDDASDALHLATLLMHYGYIFPVIEPSTTVKDDNTLYRIQLPYFWPSHAQQTDNIEYAIYLNKRLMRNEQKHGLDENEVAAYNKLVELLGHMWGFITTQAEMQLKLQKEKKKIEKIVFDSEERAFWTMRQPGQPNCLEQHIQKIERRIRKMNIQGHRQEVERLKLALKTKPWLKAMKASETVEVPTEKRVKRWGLSVNELVRDVIGRQVLETFLESEFSSENIRFWIAIQDIKYAADSQVEAKAQRIHDEFLAPGAPCQVNVDSRTLEDTLKQLKNPNVARRHAFSNAEDHVFTLMSKDSYPRFMRSQIYKGVLTAAQQQGSRRLGWRSFIVFNQKRTPLTVAKHKTSRDDNIQVLPKQLSSDSLPLKIVSIQQQQQAQQAASNPTTVKRENK